MPAPRISLKSLPCRDILDTSTWDLHPFLDTVNMDTLKTSIGKVGILHPPVVVETNDGAHDIVSGRKRIQCAKSLGIENVFCRVLPRTTPATTLLRFLFEDQTAARPLSRPEAAIFLKVCLRHLGKNEALAMLPEEYLPKKNPLPLQSLLTFDDAILQRLHHGLLTDRIIPDLLQLTHENRKRIIHLIEDLQLGGNKQKRLLNLCRDITLRDGISLVSLLDEADIKEIIEHTAMNTPQKTGRIFDILQRRCFPRSTKERENFQAHVRDLLLPETFTLSPSPFFERDEVTLSIHFPDFETCRKALPSLKRHLIDD